MSAPNSYNTTNLVSNVQLIAHIPLSNSTFTSPEIINLADRELKTALISQILSVREGYYLTYTDYAINATGQFTIPSQAIGGALSAIQLVVGPSVQPINRIEVSEQFSTLAPSSTTYGYFIAGNTINVLPVPSTGSVRVWFLRRPNALVSLSAAGLITGIASNVITVSSLPTTFAVNTTVNLCQDQPPFDVLATRTISAINGVDVTLDSPVTGLALSDWLCLQDQTPVPQIPVEFRPLLEQRVAVKMYELQGYLDKMKAAGEMLVRMETDLFKLITPRVQTQTKIINPQTGGFLSNSTQRASMWGSNT